MHNNKKNGLQVLKPPFQMSIVFNRRSCLAKFIFNCS